MFKKLAMGLVLGASLVSTAMADMNGTVTSLLNELDVKYELHNGKILIPVDSKSAVVITCKNDVFSVEAFIKTQIPVSKWPAAYRVLNKMNKEGSVKFYLDNDGDVILEHRSILTDMTLSEAVVRVYIYAMIKGMEDVESAFSGF